MAGRRVTLDEVANASNASSATVSLALRNKPGVSRETRERILATAHALGYQRTIRAGRDNGAALRNIALIFRTWSDGPERSSPALNPFYSWVLTGVQEAGNDAAMNLLLGTIPVDAENHPLDLPAAMLGQPLDGVLLVGSHRRETVDRILDLLGHPTPPVVLVDALDQGHGLDSVSSDNRGGAYRATVHLIESGHTRIGYVGPRSEWDPNFGQRVAGFRRALHDHGLEPAAFREYPDEGVGQTGLDSVLLAATASFCGNDDFALAMLREAVARGITIPDQHSVIGFDDTRHSRDAAPPLSTMAVDKLALGRLAVQALEYRIKWPESAPISVVTAAQLIQRGSVRMLTRDE
ncbi:MAG: LacI family DNA-binding transcriptional regulator [Chloroflexia bacterium]|nr:LacI family DNA-binding transcriptional regulator [Chloroflexia bacterium]